MIRILLRLPILLVILVILTWVAVLGFSPSADAVLGGATRDLARSYPEAQTRARLGREAAALGAGLGPLVPDLGPGRSDLVRAGLLATALHSQMAIAVLPILLLLILGGGSAGLVLRERLRDAQGYASPTAAGLARAAIAGGLLWLGLYSLSPLPVSAATLYAASLAMTLGGILYAANLPLRL